METIPAKNNVIKTKKSAMWFGADYNMNIYRGCTHGCIYCDSRSECYGNSDFENVKMKADALKIVRDDLRRKMKTGVVATGSMSDPYNPAEQELCLTRSSLELLNAYGFGVAIATKSVLVARDIDILCDIKTHSPVIVKLTITTADAALCGKLEPYAPAAADRFAALKALSEAGIYCGVLMMPILPFINDSSENIRGILSGAAAAGAKFVYPAMGVTLRSGNREYFYERLDNLFPGIKQKYIKTFANNYMCVSPDTKDLWKTVQSECERLGLLYNMRSIISAYKMGYTQQQLSLY